MKTIIDTFLRSVCEDVLGIRGDQPVAKYMSSFSVSPMTIKDSKGTVRQLRVMLDGELIASVLFDTREASIHESNYTFEWDEDSSNEPKADDASRYQWLRERAFKDGDKLCVEVGGFDQLACGNLSEGFDTLVDKARGTVTGA